MHELEPGHVYSLATYDGSGPQMLTFMKRVGEGYPRNESPGHPGTNIQEVLRALIARVEHLNGQAACAENDLILGHLRSSIFLLEVRAARRHGREAPDLLVAESIDELPTCQRCGHWHRGACQGASARGAFQE